MDEKKKNVFLNSDGAFFFFVPATKVNPRVSLPAFFLIQEVGLLVIMFFFTGWNWSSPRGRHCCCCGSSGVVDYQHSGRNPASNTTFCFFI